MKISIARKNLFQDKSRFLIGVLGIAFAIILIFLLEGFKVGIYKQISVYFDNLDTNLIVTQEGVENLTASRSTISMATKDEVEKVNGVQKVTSLYANPVMFDQDDVKTPIYMLGYDTYGGPWKMGEGNEPVNNDEVVFDTFLAQKYDLKVDDKVKILDKEFTISGLSLETASYMSPYIFVRKEAAAEILTENSEWTNFLLVKVTDSEKSKKIQKRIKNKVKNIEVFTKQELSNNDQKVMEEIMGSVLNVMTAIAYIIGILVIGLTIYSSVWEKNREYGIIKAIGESNFRLYMTVIKQSIFSTIIGFIIGIGLSVVLAKLIELYFPQFLVLVLDPQVILRTFIAAIIMSILAAFIPVKKISHIDPAIVFKT